MTAQNSSLIGRWRVVGPPTDPTSCPESIPESTPIQQVIGRHQWWTQWVQLALVPRKKHQGDLPRSVRISGEIRRAAHVWTM